MILIVIKLSTLSDRGIHLKTIPTTRETINNNARVKYIVNIVGNIIVIIVDLLYQWLCTSGGKIRYRELCFNFRGPRELRERVGKAEALGAFNLPSKFRAPQLPNAYLRCYSTLESRGSIVFTLCGAIRFIAQVSGIPIRGDVGNPLRSTLKWGGFVRNKIL